MRRIQRAVLLAGGLGWLLIFSAVCTLIAASVGMNQRQHVIGPSSPFERTATHIVWAATGTEMAQSLWPTPRPPIPLTTPVSIITQQPTLTPTALLYTTEKATQRLDEFMDIVISEIGFDHPAFEPILWQLVEEESHWRFQVRQFDPEVAVTWFAENNYVAAIVPAGAYLGSHRFLLFRITDGVPTLIEGLTRGLNEDGWHLYFDSGPLPNGNVSTAGFDDRNNNGLPDLAIMRGDTGNCCLPVLILLEISENGEVRDITPDSSDVQPAYFVDLGSDGVWEIVGILRVPVPYAGFRTLTRWYGWDGSAYVDISAQRSDFYNAEIDAFVGRLAQHNGCYPPGVEIYQVLLDYYAMGRLEEGWAELRPLLRWEDCSPSQLAEYREGMDELGEWVQDPPIGRGPWLRD